MTSLNRTTSRGKRWDIDVRQGATFGPYRLRMRNPDGSLMDVTGWQYRGQIRKDYGQPVVATHDLTPAANPADGYFDVGLSADVTASIPCGPFATSAASRYRHDIEIVDSVGRVIETVWGVVTVRARVTRS